MKIDQTITLGDPKRLGNCFAACVATYFSVPLEEVPHFIELGQRIATETLKSSEEDRGHWWAAFLGYCSAKGAWPRFYSDLKDVPEGEVSFVAGRSQRGVYHQVLYLNGELYHDPHLSRTGLVSVEEIFTLEQGLHDHSPTNRAQP